VLEHIRDTRPALATSLRLLRPGGWAYHGIDLRDHLDFTRPLDFLTLEEDEFCRQQPGNSRWRFTDHRQAFTDVGFTVEDEELIDSIPIRPDGSTDCYYYLSRPIHRLYVPDVERIDPWVTEEMRRSFHPDFHNYSLAELSVLAYNVAVSRS
jgi:hypothetical protein